MVNRSWSCMDIPISFTRSQFFPPAKLFPRQRIGALKSGVMVSVSKRSLSPRFPFGVCRCNLTATSYVAAVMVKSASSRAIKLVLHQSKILRNSTLRYPAQPSHRSLSAISTRKPSLICRAYKKRVYYPLAQKANDRKERRTSYNG